MSFGDELRQQREARLLSMRAAAERAGISEGLWRQLEKGYRQVTKDVTVPVNPRSSTVVAAARAVGWAPEDALRAIGRPRDAEAVEASAVGPSDEDAGFVADNGGEPALVGISDEDLLRKIREGRAAKEELDRRYGA